MRLGYLMGLGATQGEFDFTKMFEPDWEELGKDPEHLVVASMAVAQAEALGVDQAIAKWAINRYLTTRGKTHMIRKAFAVWPYSEAQVEKELEELKGYFWDNVWSWPYGPEIITDYEELLEDTEAGRKAFAMTAFLEGEDVPPAELPQNLTREEVQQAQAEHEASKGLGPPTGGGDMLPILFAVLVGWWFMRGRR